MYSRRKGLFFAKRSRLCPPTGEVTVAEKQEKLDMHRKICPYCGTDSPVSDKAWSDLAQRLKDILHRSTKPDLERAGPGQLRIASTEGVWRGSFHYSPPLVVILEVLGAVSDEVLVAQTYMDLTMAGPGDLVLPFDSNPFGDIFVEPWNTYTLRACGLGPVLSRLDQGIVKAIRTMAVDSSAYPPWAMRPRPLDPSDPRLSFRKLEVEIAYTFASRAVDEILELARARTEPLQPVPEDIRKAVLIRFPGSKWRKLPQTIERAAALVRLPDDALPLAATKGDHVQWPVPVITMFEGRVGEVDLTTCEVMQETSLPGGLELSGVVNDLPDTGLESELIIFLELPDGDVIEPETADWEAESGFFFARFPVRERGSARLALAVIFGAGEEDE